MENVSIIQNFFTENVFYNTKPDPHAPSSEKYFS